jgi:hypothetical protein
LYPDCEDENIKLGITLELLQWKAETGLSDKGFEKLLKIMKKKLPKDNELPDSTYEAKKVLCPLGLEVQKIHACINECILYRGEEYENLEACPVCTALRYKIRRDDPSRHRHADRVAEVPPRERRLQIVGEKPIVDRPPAATRGRRGMHVHTNSRQHAHAQALSRQHVQTPSSRSKPAS